MSAIHSVPDSLRAFGCITILCGCIFVGTAGVSGLRAHGMDPTRLIGIGSAEDLAIANEVTHGLGHVPPRRLRLLVVDRTTTVPASGVRVRMQDQFNDAIVDRNGFAVLTDHGTSRRERIEAHCPRGTPDANKIVLAMDADVRRPRTDLLMRVDLASCRPNATSTVSGRFDGIYHYNLMETDWFFPCDGTQPSQVENSRELFRHAESIHQRFPGAFVRRNGVYLTALGANEINGERRTLDVVVILSMGPERPADCRTPDRDHAMAMAMAMPLPVD